MLAEMARDDAFRERVRQANDIVVVVGERVALRTSGAGRYKGLCPFHEEKTPSFSVSEERQAYYCFGCRESGDVFAFTMKTDGLDFPGALAALARRAGIPMPERDSKKASRTEVLRKANEHALRFFRRELRGPEGRQAFDYLRGRGLSERTIDECGLGFAPDAWNRLGETLGKQGVPASALVESGLSREGKGRRYDFFRGRLMVPIHDAQGRVAGFAGRSLDGSEPKYVNSPESPIYFKRSVLYGLDRARPAIRAERSAILFEGYFDCLSAWQAGIPGAVAVCGTALSPEHARLLAPSCREVVVAFDSDSAGRKAAEAAVPVLLGAGLSVRVASFEEGGDPDDAIREQGGAAFRERLAAAPGFLDFLLEEAVRAPGGAAAGSDARREAARRVAGVIAGSADALARDDWTREAAGRLGFSPDAFAAEVERARRRPARVSGTAPVRTAGTAGTAGTGSAGRPAAPSGDGEPAGPPTPVERDLILWAESRPGEVARLLRETGPEDLEGLATTPLLLEMREAAAAGREDWEGLVGRSAAEPGPVQRQVNEILMAPVPLNEEGQRPEDCFSALRLRRLRREQERLRAALREGAESAGGEDPLQEFQEVTREIEEVRARITRGG